MKRDIHHGSLLALFWLIDVLDDVAHGSNLKLDIGKESDKK